MKPLGQRALLTAALWVGYWVMGTALAAALLWVPIAQMRYQRSLGLAGFLAGAAAVSLLWALRPRFARKNFNDERTPLERAEAPELFELVEDVARLCRQPPPQKLFLCDEATAFISEERRWFGLKRTRVVGVGMPLFVLLTRDELRSVIAHELGHQADGDIMLGPWIYRTHVRIAEAVGSLEGSALFLDVPFRAYGTMMLRLTSGVSREQELAADALAASIAGARIAATALDKVHAYAALWETYFALEVLPLVASGVRVPLVEGFRRFLAAREWRPAVERRIREADARPPTPHDSHPPLDVRVRALGSTPGAQDKRALPEGCLELVQGPDGLERAWIRCAVRGTLTEHPWEALGAAVVVPNLEKSLEGLQLDPKTPLTELPKRLSEGERLFESAPSFGLSLLSHEAKKKLAKDTLCDWLAVALAQRGFAPELHPGCALQLRRDGKLVDPSLIVQALAEGTMSESEYRAWCEWAER